MIRNVVMIQLKPDHDHAEVAEVSASFAALDTPGMLSYTIGDDLGLRDGNWSLAIVADLADAEAYRVYDLDAEHNALRARLAPHAAQIARVQFELPDPA